MSEFIYSERNTKNKHAISTATNDLDHDPLSLFELTPSCPSTLRPSHFSTTISVRSNDANCYSKENQTPLLHSPSPQHHYGPITPKVMAVGLKKTSLELNDVYQPQQSIYFPPSDVYQPQNDTYQPQNDTYQPLPLAEFNSIPCQSQQYPQQQQVHVQQQSQYYNQQQQQQSQYYNQQQQYNHRYQEQYQTSIEQTFHHDRRYHPQQQPQQPQQQQLYSSMLTPNGHFNTINNNNNNNYNNNDNDNNVNFQPLALFSTKSSYSTCNYQQNQENDTNWSKGFRLDDNIKSHKASLPYCGHEQLRVQQQQPQQQLQSQQPNRTILSFLRSQPAQPVQFIPEPDFDPNNAPPLWCR